jgi:hypothetical protein
MKIDPNALDGHWVLLIEEEPLDDDSQLLRLCDGLVWVGAHTESVGTYEFKGAEVVPSITMPEAGGIASYSYQIRAVGALDETGAVEPISPKTSFLSASICDTAGEPDGSYCALLRDGDQADATRAANRENPPCIWLDAPAGTQPAA